MDSSRKRPREGAEQNRTDGDASGGRAVKAKNFDPAWYGADDAVEQCGMGETADDVVVRSLAEHAAKQKRPVGPAGELQRPSMRRTQMQREEDAWRKAQLRASGVEDGQGGSASLSAGVDGDRQDRQRIEIIREADLVPPFLSDTTVLFSRQQQRVLPVKDPKSDFAANARKGSETLRHFREEQALKKAAREEMMIDGEVPGEGNKQRLKPAQEGRTHDIDDVRHMREAASMKPQDLPAPDAAALALTRKNLPIFLCREKLLNAIGENDVLIVQGETGSGKTTQIVQYLYEAGYARDGLIGCTQPRRMAAVGVAHRVSVEMGCALGALVGYAIRLEDETSEETKIKFMTDGVLLREVVAEQSLNKYRAIIMDEAHERSVNTDILLGVLKDLSRRRADLKIIVTSATMDVEKFSRFFSAPVFQISGRTFPVEVSWEAYPVDDYVREAVMRVVDIHVKQPPGDILVFMTGKEDVETVCELIRQNMKEHFAEFADSLLVMPCYSVLPSMEQMRILSPTPPGKRKCVVATNVAETSLTIDGIRYVVDSGYMKTNVFNPHIGMNTLQVYPVCQAQADQRMGRAGRTAEGLCYRLYTRYQYQEELLAMAVPEIQRSSIDSVVLLLKNIGVNDLLKFDFIDPPPEDNIRSSLYHLWLLQAIDDAGTITEEGRIVADIPTEPAMARALAQSCLTYGCGEEMLSICCMLTVDAKSVFTLPKGREEAAMRAREKFFVPESDHLTLLNVYEQYRSNGRSRAWAAEHFLNFSTMERACDIRTQLRERLVRSLKLHPKSCECDWDCVRKCIASGFFPRVARRKSWDEYTTILTNVTSQLHPSSALQCAATMPDYIVYNDFILTSKEYLSIATAVDAEWLVEVSNGVLRKKDDANSQLKAMVRKAQLKVVGGQERGPCVHSVIASAGQRIAATTSEDLKERQMQLQRKRRPTSSM